MYTKYVWSAVLRFMSVPTENPELLKAKYQAFSHMMPMMYLILIANTWALATTHMLNAPGWLTVLVPLAFSLACGARIVFWWRAQGRFPGLENAHAVLTRTNWLAAILGSAFTAWSLALFPYGDAYMQSHVAFYMAITVISCIFCLTHLRSAAFIVAGIVNGIFIVFFLSVGHPTFIAISINVALVCTGMLVILMSNYKTFKQMIEAQQYTEALSLENLRLANIDSLSNLPNRRAFFADLRDNIKQAKQRGIRIALGIMDLDGFKPINDLYGHSVGDSLLVEVGARLSKLPPTCQVYRLGGDEFAIIEKDTNDDDQLIIMAKGLVERMIVPFDLTEASVQISASMGIAVYPDTASTTEQLFDRADYALYHAKRNHRGGAILFNAEHEVLINDEARIEQALKQADISNELRVVFQPIVDIRTRKTVGFEALGRWASPTLGNVSPSLFFPIAERAGIVRELTRPLLRRALIIAKEWNSGIRLSFNLSAHDLNSHDSVLAIVEIIESSGFSLRNLDLEITETAFTHDFEQVKRSIEMLRLLGCGISLDDFGTGYSSLSRLHALPLTRIKIDRSFVTDLHKTPASYKIIKSLLALSRDMELDCVVEGVETEEELSTIRALGGVLVQGYVFSPPIAACDVENYLSETTKKPLRK